MSSTSPTPAKSTAQRRRFTVDALFTDTRPRANGVQDLTTAKEIQLDRIVPDPTQPRRNFDEHRMQELVASIAAEGVLQPIVVRYDESDDIYVIVHGERRWRASRQARIRTIPAIVRDVPEDRRLIHQLMENIVREDLNALDRAAALRALKLQLHDASWEEVADAVAIKRSRLFQLLGTEKLPASIQTDIREGRLSEKQSRALQGLPEAAQLALRDAIIAEGLTADESQKLARKLKAERLDDRPESIALKLVEWRTGDPSKNAKSSTPDDALALLEAISKSVTGSAGDREALARAADDAWAAPFDPERLEEQIHGIARTLSRMPATQLKPGTAAFGHLRALHRTLGVLLDVPQSS
jgi:ParB family transcriptional regulator, chromosome partitioning protein